jgi:hypothetical protein
LSKRRKNLRPLENGIPESAALSGRSLFWDIPRVETLG